MIGNLYTLGYAHPNAAATLQAWMASDPKMLLVDIRYSPRSRWFPQWSQKALQAVWGDRYQHVKALGNVNYRFAGAPIHLADPDAGIAWAVQARHSGYSLTLLCACKDYECCHRKTVKELIEDAVMAQVRE